jgi:hypothetical protein
MESKGSGLGAILGVLVGIIGVLLFGSGVIIPLAGLTGMNPWGGLALIDLLGLILSGSFLFLFGRKLAR